MRDDPVVEDRDVLPRMKRANQLEICLEVGLATVKVAHVQFPQHSTLVRVTSALALGAHQPWWRIVINLRMRVSPWFSSVTKH